MKTTVPGERASRMPRAAIRAGFLLSEASLTLLTGAVLVVVLLIGARTDDAASKSAKDESNPVRELGVAGPTKQHLVVVSGRECVVTDLASGESFTLWASEGTTDAHKLAVSPTAPLMFLSQCDGRAHALHLTRGEHLWNRDLQAGEPVACAVSPDGEHLALGTDRGTILLLAATTGKEQWRIEQKTNAKPLCFSHDGKQLFVPTQEGGIAAVDAETGSETMRFDGSFEFISTVASSPDGKYVAAGTLDGQIVLWNAHTGRQQRLIDDSKGVRKIIFSLTENEIITGSADGQIRFRNLPDLATTRCLVAHDDVVRDLDIAGDLIISGGYDGLVKAWNVNTLAECDLRIDSEALPKATLARR